MTIDKASAFGQVIADTIGESARTAAPLGRRQDRRVVMAWQVEAFHLLTTWGIIAEVDSELRLPRSARRCHLDEYERTARPFSRKSEKALTALHSDSTYVVTQESSNSLKEIFRSVGPKGQVTLPIEFRRSLGIKPKDKVAVRLGRGKIEITLAPSPRDSYQAVPALKPPRSWKEIEALVGEEMAREVLK